jgi:hypothetical protein
MEQMNENTRALARELAAECATTEDITGLLKKLFGETIEEIPQPGWEHIVFSDYSEGLRRCRHRLIG